MSNLPILVRNTCDGLTEGGQKLYLDLMDRYQGWNNKQGEVRAFLEADRYDRNVGQTLTHILDHGPLLGDIQVINHNWKQDMQRFMADRWKNNFMKEKDNAA